MTHKITGPIESFVPLGAGVLLVPHVNFYMASQDSSLGKSLFTHRAGVRLLSSMDSHVFVHGTGLGKGLVTGGAGEELFSCVCPLVSPPVTRDRESLAWPGLAWPGLSPV